VGLVLALVLAAIGMAVAGRPGLGRARAVWFPAVARRLGPARRLGTVPAVVLAVLALAVRHRTSRPGCRGVACWGGVRQRAGLDARARAGRRGRRRRRRARPPVRVPRHRAGDDRPAGDAGRVRQPDPRRLPRPVARARSPATRRAR
jgi:hypothetical protein